MERRKITWEEHSALYNSQRKSLCDAYATQVLEGFPAAHQAQRTEVKFQ